eukprot:1197886-Pyramimonas_sp.AAC.1
MVVVSRLSKGGLVRPSSACCADLVALLATLRWADECTPLSLYEAVFALGGAFKTVSLDSVSHLPVVKTWPDHPSELPEEIP